MLLTCADPEEVRLRSDSEFFPLQVGLYHIYGIEETQFTSSGGPIDMVYKMKLAVIDSFRNSSGGTTYVIHRSVQQVGQTEFEYKDTWSARLDIDRVVVNEGNIPFVRLAFPLVLGKQWNGNALNELGGEQTCGGGPTFACDVYKILNANEPFEFKGEILESLQVEQNNNTDLIVKQDVRKELYVRNIGLVYKESSVLEYCTVGSCIGQQQIETGFILKQTLEEYGKE